jgi:hypothetical protein
MMPPGPGLLHLLMGGPWPMPDHRGMRTRSLLLAALVAALLTLGDGTVRAWGANTYGQLGDGTTIRRTSPMAVPGLAGVETVTAGRAYSAAR